jgi:CBS domain-containing protein
MTATVRDVLAMKNSAVVYTCPPDATVADACRTLRDRRVGCLVVARGGAVQGIFTERDVVLRVVAPGLDAAETRVCDVMTRDVEAATLELSADEAEAVLRRQRVRHLPVVGDRGLLGVVSLGDLARFYALHERGEREARRGAVVAP